MLMLMDEPNPAPPPISPNGNKPADPYEFFMKEPAAAKKPLLPGGSMKSRLFMIVGGVFVLLVIISVVAMLAGGDDTKTLQLAGVAKQQNEVVRMADIGANKARALNVRNFSVTVQLSLASQQSTLQKALKTQGVKTSSASLDTAKKTRNDEKLSVAQQNNRYDEVLLEILTTELSLYQKALKTAHSQAAAKTFKDAMAVQYQKAATLAGQIPETSP